MRKVIAYVFYSLKIVTHLATLCTGYRLWVLLGPPQGTVLGSGTILVFFRYNYNEGFITSNRQRFFSFTK